MHHCGITSRAGILLLALLPVACASPVPQAIRQAPADNPSLAAVHAGTADYLGRQLRWGGTIIETENREDATWLTVLGQTLRNSGKPRYSDDSAGRFIAIVPEFLDPKVYAPDRRLTVTGTLLRSVEVMVGEYAYTYPVVQAEAWYLWPAEPDWRRGYPDPWWHDPWGYRPWYYDRWYPYSPPYGY